MICYPLTPTPPTFHLPNNTTYVNLSMALWVIFDQEGNIVAAAHGVRYGPSHDSKDSSSKVHDAGQIHAMFRKIAWISVQTSMCLQ